MHVLDTFKDHSALDARSVISVVMPGELAHNLTS
jgi:hypothetical protein